MKRGLIAAFAACLVVPLWAWSPYVLDDARLDGGLLALCVLGVLGAARGVPALRGSGCFLAGLAAGLPALLLGPDPQIHGALQELPPPWGGLVDRAPLLSAWALACAAAARPAALSKAWPWIFGGVAAASGYGVLQILGFDPLGLRPEPHSPPSAPLAGTNHAAELLAPALVALLGWAGPLGSGARSQRWLLAFLPAAFQLGYLGVLAARLSLPLGLALAARRDRALLSGAVLLLAAFGAGEAARMLHSSPAAAQAAAPSDGAAAAAFALPDSLRLRWLTDVAALQRAAGAPLGIGLGRFETDFPFWRSAEMLRLASADYQDPATPQPKDPHCEPLLAVLECGWLGAALLGLGLWRAARRPERARWTNPALAALAVHALVRSPWSDNPISLALAALLLGSSQESPPAAGRAAAELRSAAKILPWLCALLGAAAAVPQIAGEWLLSRRFAAVEAGAAPGPAPAERAAAVRPWDAVAWCLLSYDRNAAGQAPERSRAALRAALRHDPANLNALTALVKLEMTAPDRDENVALAALARAESVAPRHPVVREARTLWLETQAELQRQQALQQILAGDPTGRGRLLAAHLLNALAQARRGDAEAARAALNAAAVYVQNQRGLVERAARHPELDESVVRDLIRRLAPDWEAYLGPAPEAAGTKS